MNRCCKNQERNIGSSQQGYSGPVNWHTGAHAGCPLRSSRCCCWGTLRDLARFSSAEPASPFLSPSLSLWLSLSQSLQTVEEKDGMVGEYLRLRGFLRHTCNFFSPFKQFRSRGLNRKQTNPRISPVGRLKLNCRFDSRNKPMFRGVWGGLCMLYLKKKLNNLPQNETLYVSSWF